MNKSAEALVRGAHELAELIVEGVTDPSQLHHAIDLALAARAVEVAEQMHAPNCLCHAQDGMKPCRSVGAGHYVHPFTDPRCTEARSRLRADYERLANGR